MEPLLLPEALQLSTEESNQVRDILGNPTVQKYFKLLHAHAIRDVTSNPVETPEEEATFLVRYKKYLGVQHVCTFIEQNYGKKE